MQASHIKKLRQTLSTIQLLLVASLLALSMLFTVFSSTASAGQLTSRKLALSTSAGNTAATWTFTFDVAATTALNGISFQPCTTPSGACTIPTSWTNSGSALSTLTYNGSSQSSWALDNAAGFIRIKNNASATTVANPVVATFNTVTNPNTTNEAFYVRIVTYTGDDFTGALDNGVVAASTTQPITVSATVAESLTFCTGTSGISTSSCSGATGSSASLGALSAAGPVGTTSQIGVATNAGSGFAITYTGTTLTSGGNSIDAMTGSSNVSDLGTEEFGLNVKDNATPDVGVEPDIGGNSAPAADYGTADEFKFVTGDTLVSDSGPEAFSRYTVAYMANISSSTEPGTYTSTVTYICTPTF